MATYIPSETEKKIDVKAQFELGPRSVMRVEDTVSVMMVEIKDIDDDNRAHGRVLFLPMGPDNYIQVRMSEQQARWLAHELIIQPVEDVPY